MMKIIDTCIVILAFSIMAILCLGISKSAGGAETNTLVRTYVVQPGDTYWDIAFFYHRQQDRYKEIKDFEQALQMRNNYKMLRPGDILEISLESVAQ